MGEKREFRCAVELGTSTERKRKWNPKFIAEGWF
jgi:hypothetical protein